jgi:cytidylate kinase
VVLLTVYCADCLPFTAYLLLLASCFGILLSLISIWSLELSGLYFVGDQELRIMRASPLQTFGAYLQAHAATHVKPHEWRRPSITISRETGSGAVTIAQMLVERLNADASLPKGSTGWTVFDHNLATQVLLDHQLPEKLERFMVEDARLPVESIVEELLGLHPTLWTFVQQTTKTILRLAMLGRAIIVGRGGEVITRRLPYVFHVRLVAPLEMRIEHAVRYYKLSLAEATKKVKETDLARQRYLRRYFDADPNNPLLYDLVVNTERLGFARSAELIAHAAMERYQDFLRAQQSTATSRV